jgi:Tfp pilus assembly protein PilV
MPEVVIAFLIIACVLLAAACLADDEQPSRA